MSQRNKDGVGYSNLDSLITKSAHNHYFYFLLDNADNNISSFSHSNDHVLVKLETLTSPLLTVIIKLFSSLICKISMIAFLRMWVGVLKE